MRIRNQVVQRNKFVQSESESSAQPKRPWPDDAQRFKLESQSVQWKLALVDEFQQLRQSKFQLWQSKSQQFAPIAFHSASYVPAAATATAAYENDCSKWRESNVSKCARQLCWSPPTATYEHIATLTSSRDALFR